jgi:hypothetical protein
MRTLHICSSKSANRTSLGDVTKKDISSVAIVVLYIDENFLRHRNLINVLGWLTDRKGKSFRCYVYPQHCTPKEFIDWLTTDEAVAWQDFSDVYHLSEERICTEEQLEDALKNVSREFSNERRYRFHKRTRVCINNCVNVNNPLRK